MQGSKPWFMSKTIVATLIALVLSIAHTYGGIYRIIEGNKAEVDATVTLLQVIIAAVAIYGRVSAKKGISTDSVKYSHSKYLKDFTQQRRREKGY
jgi:hypothetical protein